MFNICFVIYIIFYVIFFSHDDVLFESVFVITVLVAFIFYVANIMWHNASNCDV